MKFKKIFAFFNFGKIKKSDDVYSEMDTFFTDAIKKNDFTTITSMLDAGYKINETQQKLFEKSLTDTFAILLPKDSSGKQNDLYRPVNYSNGKFGGSVYFWQHYELLVKYDILDNFILNNLSSNNTIGKFFNLASALPATNDSLLNFKLDFNDCGNPKDENLKQNVYNSLLKSKTNLNFRHLDNHQEYEERFLADIESLLPISNPYKINFLALNNFDGNTFRTDKFLNPKFMLPSDNLYERQDVKFIGIKSQQFYDVISQFGTIILNRIVSNLPPGDISVISEEILDNHNLYTYLSFNNCAYHKGITANQYNTEIGDKILKEVEKEKQNPLIKIISNNFFTSIENQIKFQNDYIRKCHPDLHIKTPIEKQVEQKQSDLNRFLEVLNQKNNHKKILNPENHIKDIITQAQFSEKVELNLINTINRKNKIMNEFKITDEESRLLNTVESKIYELIELKDLINEESTMEEHSFSLHDKIFKLELQLLNKKQEEIANRVQEMEQTHNAKKMVLKR